MQFITLLVDHREAFCRAREWARQQQHQFDSSCMKGLTEAFDQIRYHAFQRAVEGKWKFSSDCDYVSRRGEEELF